MLNGIVALVWVLALGAQAAPASDRIYGRVRAVDGRTFEGYLRWDRNETQWADILDGEKAIPPEHDREAERLDPELRRRRELERRIDLPGLRISWDEDDGEPRTTVAGVRFGHVRSIEVAEGLRAVVALVSGQEVELRSTSSDIGRTFRGLVVEDRERGEVELRWRELERVDLFAAPPEAPRPNAERLYGTVRTRDGVHLTGYVAWDRDETLSTDVLDGRERDVGFASVAALKREGRNATRVTLRSGEELLLTGTNDVNDRNRGIEISDPSLGRAIVPWEAFESVAFSVPPVDGTSGARAAFDGGVPLAGTVETRPGAILTGRIRWDNDEESTWEMLDGRSGGVDYDVELGQVHVIEPVGDSGARVALRDGRSLLLEESTDVDGENQGVFILAEGRETVLVPWRDLERVTFTR